MSQDESAMTTNLSIPHRRLDEAAVKAQKLVENYAAQDPHSGSEQNPWKEPEEMFRQLKAARDELVVAWDDFNKQKADKDDTISMELEGGSEDDFRALYMNMVTDAFADILENMHQTEGDVIDVEVLVDCLQSGVSFLTAEERSGFFASLEGEGDSGDDGEDSNMTPHERRKRQLGLDVSVSG